MAILQVCQLVFHRERTEPRVPAAGWPGLAPKVPLPWNKTAGLSLTWSRGLQEDWAGSGRLNPKRVLSWCSDIWVFCWSCPAAEGNWCGKPPLPSPPSSPPQSGMGRAEPHAPTKNPSRPRGDSASREPGFLRQMWGGAEPMEGVVRKAGPRRGVVTWEGGAPGGRGHREAETRGQPRHLLRQSVFPPCGSSQFPSPFLGGAARSVLSVLLPPSLPGHSRRRVRGGL